MNRRSLARLALLASLAPLAGCPGNGDENTTDTAGGDCAAHLAGGELVITELFPDPAGKDADGVEWFEIYNATGAPISLSGVGLVLSKADGTDPQGHLIMADGLEIPAGAYMTFGGVTDDARPPHVDYGHGSDLGSLSNTSGRITVYCGDVVVDEVIYDETKVKDGVSAIFDGDLTPDAADNDDLNTWCPSPTDVEPFFMSEFGSPQAANAPCPLPTPSSCGQCYDGEELRDAVAPQPGQLVITEIMPNAAATDTSLGEWFEVTVTDGSFDLNCLQYGNNTTKFAADPTSAEIHEPADCHRVEAGDVLLFSELPWAETDVETGMILVDSPSDSNPDPGVYIAFDGAILDEVHYTSPKDGVAFSLDPQWTTVDGNDDPAHFCLAHVPFAEGDLGTPGAANPACLANPCQDPAAGGDARESVRPEPGQIFITEVHANASTDIGGEPDGEWIEFFATDAFDLNGLQLGKSATSISFDFDNPVCLSVGPGLVLLARDSEAGKMLNPDATYTTLQLGNTGGALWIGVDGVELDSMPYGSPKDGVACQVDAAVVDAFITSGDLTLNDGTCCDATQPYPPFNLDKGTPGATNTACEGGGGIGKCVDPDTMMERDIDRPGPNEILITEFMANPKKAGDATAEWFEITACAEFDLNGLEIGKVWDPYTVVETIPEPGPCIEVKTGDEAILARSADPVLSGDLPVTPAYVLTKLSLTNTSGSIFVGVGGVDLDHVAYTTTSEAKATQLSVEHATCPVDATNNDAEANWCLATTVYNTVDTGTPGADNLMCGGGGGLTCFDTGMMMDRDIVSPAPGDLVITEFIADPNVVTDSLGEWFEVRAAKAVDLNLVKALGKSMPTPVEVTGAKTFADLAMSPNCIPVAAGGFALIARNADPMMNGGLPTVDAVTTINLGNMSGGISLHVADQLLDAVGWAMTKSAGKSQQLAPDILDPAQNDNADAAPWCTAAGAGTPKQENPVCP